MSGLNRREFLSLLTAALIGPRIETAAEPPLNPDPLAFAVDDAWWRPWVQYIEPGKPVTFEHPFHLRMFGVDVPGELPNARCEVLINGKLITEAPLPLFVDHGFPIHIFPTIEVPAGTSFEFRCDVPDVIFCAQGDMKYPEPPEPQGDPLDFEDDDEDDQDDYYDEYYDRATDDEENETV